MIRCVVFDFDGTLVLSNDIKRDSFDVVASRFPNGAVVMRGLLSTLAADRAEIWARFAERIEAPHLAATLTDEFTRVCRDRILECPERSGASETLRALRASGMRLYVNSSTPSEALQPLVAARFPAYFDGVLGGYGMKRQNLEAIVRTERMAGADVMVVGDGLDDRDAAAGCACQFAAVAGPVFESSGGAGTVVDDLRGLLALIRREV